MAKQFSVTQAIAAIAKGARAEVDPTLTAEEKSAKVNEAMNVLENSDFVTLAENADEGIAEQARQEAERLLAEQAADEEEQPEG